MAERSKLLMFSKWAGLTVLLAIGASWGMTCGRYGPAYRFAPRLHIGIGNGSVGIMMSQPGSGGEGPGQFLKCFVNPDGDMVVRDASWAVLRSGIPTPIWGGHAISIGLDLLFACTAIPTAILWQRDRRWNPSRLRRFARYRARRGRAGLLTFLVAFVVVQALFVPNPDRRQLFDKLGESESAIVAAYLAFVLGVSYAAARFVYGRLGKLPGRAVQYCRRHNLCTECTYNLTGNESGICPECGTEVRP